MHSIFHGSVHSQPIAILLYSIENESLEEILYSPRSLGDEVVTSEKTNHISGIYFDSCMLQ